MKKILTLLLSAGIFTASYAQGKHGHKDYGRNDQYTTTSHGRYDNNGRYGNNGRYDNDDHDRDDRYQNGRYNRGNRSYAYQRQIQMDRINREYNYKIMSIQHNRRMTHRQKRLAIRDAKNQRNYQIQMLNRQMNGYARNGYGYGNNGYGRDNDDRR